MVLADAGHDHSAVAVIAGLGIERCMKSPGIPFAILFRGSKDAQVGQREDTLLPAHDGLRGHSPGGQMVVGRLSRLAAAHPLSQIRLNLAR